MDDRGARAGECGAGWFDLECGAVAGQHLAPLIRRHLRSRYGDCAPSPEVWQRILARVRRRACGHARA